MQARDDILKDIYSVIPESLNSNDNEDIKKMIDNLVTKLISYYEDINNLALLILGNEKLTARSCQRKIYSIGNDIIKTGTIFNNNGLNWKLIDVNIVKCLEIGTYGNNAKNGTILTSADGKIDVRLGEVIVLGRFEETEKEYYFRMKKDIADSRNIHLRNIEEWVKGINKVGNVKAVLKDNIIEVYATDNYGNPATIDIVDSVQQYLDPNSQGFGEGKVGIGQKVKVYPAQTINIEITAKVETTATYNESIIGDTIKEYLKDCIVLDEIKYSYLGKLLLDTNTIIDYRNFKLNNTTDNIILNDRIPILKSLELIE